MIERISLPRAIHLISWHGEGQAIAFDDRNGRTHLLDEFSAMLLNELKDASLTRRQIISALLDVHHSTNPEYFEQALVSAVDYLQERGLIESRWVEESC